MLLTTPQTPSGELDSALTNDYRMRGFARRSLRELDAYAQRTRWSLQAGLRFEQTWFETG
ncbi:MAG: hypothetical protein IPM49_08650 [Flavobacteriales bacterium]|nr:hypothetical protein [Flavobacteriales bacterium]